MSNLKHCFLLSFILFLCFFSQNSFAQTQVYGKVTDAATGEVMPFVNAKFKRSITATSTDPNGKYLLRAFDLVDSVSFSFTGYKTQTYKITRGKNQELNVRMGAGVELSEVTIKPHKRIKHVVDTPAVTLFRKIVAHKDENRPEHVKAYSYEEYSKIIISLMNPTEKFKNNLFIRPFKFVFNNVDTTSEGNKFVPILIIEKRDDVYYRKSPKKTKVITKAEQITGVKNKSIANLATFQFREIDIYDNLYVIATKSFPSPFSPTGLGTYYYYLTDTQKIDGRWCYKLSFVGKVKEDVALKGYAWIDTLTYAIKKINCRPNEKSNMNFVNDYTINQSYDYVNGKYWMLNHEYVNAVGAVVRTKKQKLTVLVQKFADRRKINPEYNENDTIFKGDPEVIQEGARQRTTAYWDSARFDTLSSHQKMIFKNWDSIHHTPIYKVYDWVLYLGSTGWLRAGPIDFGRFYKWVSRNSIEGWRLRQGFETDPNRFPRFMVFGYIAYGTKDHVVKYEGDVRYKPKVKNEYWNALEFVYRYDLNVLGAENPLLTFDNITSVFSGQKLSKLMSIREMDFNYEKEWLHGFDNIFGFSKKTYYAIPGVFDFQRPDKNNVLTPFKQFNTTELTVDFRYAFHDKYYESGYYRFFIPSIYPIINFNVALGLKNFAQGDYNYAKFKLRIYQRWNNRAGHTNYEVRAGAIVGNVPYPLAFVTAGNLGIFRDKFNYNMLREFEFVHDKYVALWIDHHFDGLLLNKIPLIRRLQLREFVTFKALWGTFDPKNYNLLTNIETTSTANAPRAASPIPYIEAGFGIENIFKIIRLDCLWRVTYRDHPGTINANPGAPNWAIKISIQPTF